MSIITSTTRSRGTEGLCSPGRWNWLANGVSKAAGKRTGWTIRTSSGCGELRPADEPEVPCPGPERLGSISEAQTGVEMVGLKSLAVVDGVVATGGVGAIHPNLQEKEGGPN